MSMAFYLYSTGIDTIPDLQPRANSARPKHLRGNATPHRTGSPSKKTADLLIQPPDNDKIPIWFSVFFGDPSLASPRLDHAHFNAKVSEKVFKTFRPLSKNLGSNGSPRKQQSFNNNDPAENPVTRQQFTIFQSLVSLNISFTNEILSSFNDNCVVCHRSPASKLVFRPLCASRHEYMGLVNFKLMHKLMTTIASHTVYINRKQEVIWSLGSILGDRPYVCSLAVPICCTEGECYRTATQMTQDYIEGILEGTVKPGPMEDDLEDKIRNAESPIQALTSTNNDGISFSHGTVNSVERVYTVGATIFVGRPCLQITNEPQSDQLSCLVFSSNWDRHNILASFSKTEPMKGYHRVAGYHEEHILQCADFRCAVCSDLVRATSLVHRPLQISQTDRSGLRNCPAGQVLKKLCQFTNGQWSYPEMNAVLGGECDAQIFELVVPICESGTICEEVARTAAREFHKLLLPAGQKPPFSDLSTDVDISDSQIEGVEMLGWQPGGTELLVERYGTACLMDGDEDRQEDPMDCALTITKLRRWYELCFKEEELKRAYLKSIGYKRTGDCSDSDSEESDMVGTEWVYYTRDNSPGLFPKLNGSDTIANVDLQEENLAVKYERVPLFQPLLTMEFFMVHEAYLREEAASIQEQT